MEKHQIRKVLKKTLLNSEGGAWIKMITITEDRYNQLLGSKAHLDELIARGVDNWDGYVGSTHYCPECDKESEWHEVGSECSGCGTEQD